MAQEQVQEPKRLFQERIKSPSLTEFSRNYKTNTVRINLQKNRVADLATKVCLESALDAGERKTYQSPNRAILLINTKSTDSSAVITQLKKVKAIDEVYPIKGKYDILAVVKAESFNQLKRTISNRFTHIAGIKSKLTLTLIDKDLAN